MDKKILVIKNKVIDKFKCIWNKTKKLGKSFKREADETITASKILLHLIEGKEATPEQIKFLKNQSIDIAKALTLIGLQAIPGSSVAIIALEKVGKKHGFTLFPKDQADPRINVNKVEKET